MIHSVQRLALEPWLQVRPGTRVLDVGCGVGRWSRLLAARGADVTGMDLSPTMIAEARRRADGARRARALPFSRPGPGEPRCGRQVRSRARRHGAAAHSGRRRVARSGAAHGAASGSGRSHGAARGRTAAPGRHAATVPSFARARAAAICGSLANAAWSCVPPRASTRRRFDTWLLPHLPQLPSPVRLAALAAVTALSLPIDVPFGRAMVERSWHAVFVLGHSRNAHAH